MPKHTLTPEQGEKLALERGTHALLNKVVQEPPCGCRIIGAGNLPSPVRIKFCKAHGGEGLDTVPPAPKDLPAVERMITAIPHQTERARKLVQISNRVELAMEEICKRIKAGHPKNAEQITHAVYMLEYVTDALNATTIIIEDVAKQPNAEALYDCPRCDHTYSARELGDHGECPECGHNL